MVMRLLRQKQTSAPIKLGIVHSDYPAAVGDIRELKKIFNLTDKIDLVEKEIPYEGIPQGIPSMLRNYQFAVDSIKSQVDYFWESSDSLAEVEGFTKILFDSGVPIVHGHTVKSVQQGALMTIRYSAQSAGALVGDMVDKIIKGQNPGSIPITVPETPSKVHNRGSINVISFLKSSYALWQS